MNNTAMTGSAKPETREIVNPFVPVEKLRRHVKMLVWGAPGSGKSYFAAKGKDIAYIDFEGTTGLYSGMDGVKAVAIPKRLRDFVDQIAFLETGKHEYRTLVVDSISVAWSMFQDELAPAAKRGNSSEIDWAAIKGPWKKMITRMMQLPMHVVLLSRAKEQKKGGKWFGEGTGQFVIDCERNVASEVDFVIHTESDFDEAGNRSFSLIIDKERSMEKIEQGKEIKNEGFQVFLEFLQNLNIM